MKSTGMTGIEKFRLDGGHSLNVGTAALRLPRPYIGRRMSGTGQPSVDANLALSNPVSGIDEYSFTASSNISVDKRTATLTSGNKTTQPFSKNMIVTGDPIESGFRNGSSNNLNTIETINTDTQYYLDSDALNSGAGFKTFFSQSGKTPLTKGNGTYGGKVIATPPPSGKLHCEIDGLSSKTINYSSWEISYRPDWWTFYISGTDETSMPAIDQGVNLVSVEHTTGDGLGSNVRVMWIMFVTNGSSNDLVLSIKSWETGEVLFKQSTPNYSSNNPQQNYIMQIPYGGIFCRGGAVFEFLESNGSVSTTSDPSCRYMYVGYQM
jgi:hypothetical protein